jgi:hypothetical protein
VKASAHAFIDSVNIIQTIPLTERAWHAGSTANSYFLGVELCMANNAAEFQEIWNRAVWLFAYWLINAVHNTKVTPDTVLSHAEVSKRWGETDHEDPVSYFAQYGKTVDLFRAAVQTEINKQLGKEEDIMDEVVLYFGDADLFAAVLVSQKNKCPLMLYQDFKDKGLKATKVIQIGGPGATAGGTNRFETFKSAATLL